MQGNSIRIARLQDGLWASLADLRLSKTRGEDKSMVLRVVLYSTHVLHLILEVGPAFVYPCSVLG